MGQTNVSCLLFCQLDFAQLQISQRIAPEERYGNLYDSLVGVDSNDFADKSFQRTMGNLDTVSDRKVDLNGFQFYAKRFDCGLGIHFGVELMKHLQIGLGYDFGLVKMYNNAWVDDDNNSRNGSFRFGVAWMF